MMNRKLTENLKRANKLLAFTRFEPFVSTFSLYRMSHACTERNSYWFGSL